MSSVRDQPSRTAVQRTADALRDEILQAGDGARLGSEDDLLNRLSVSRPTLRQTARLLEQEQLLRVRRGVNGGYYARTPDAGAVADVAAFHLRMRGTTLRETVSASFPLLEFTMRRAARGEGATARAEFEAALERFAGRDDEPSAARMLRDESEFMNRLLVLAANPPVELFLRTLYEFGLTHTTDAIFADRPARVREWLIQRERLAQAIVERDAEMAVLLGRRRREMIEGWLDEDLGARVDEELRRAAG